MQSCLHLTTGLIYSHDPKSSKHIDPVRLERKEDMIEEFSACK
jgi:hypothetical protein